MNKKISQFEVATSFEEQDILTIVQDGENKQIHIDDFQSSLSDTFATNERVDAVEGSVQNLDDKVDADYADLSNQITTGDSTTYSNVMGTMNEYYDVLNNSIITLENKHDVDMSEVNGTVQEWIDDIDRRSTIEQLNDALNRLTVAENTISALADVVANGGGNGDTVGFHTQPTSTITSLTGYRKGVNADPLVVTDTLNQALSKLENQIEAVTDTSDSLPLIRRGETTYPTDNHVYTAGKVFEDYLNRHGENSADGYIKFLSGIQGGETFQSGWNGVGASLYPANSKWNLEVDNLFVRGNMTVNELIVNEIKATGGEILVTVADIECVEVEDAGDGYRCYFDNTERSNPFRVRDQAICQIFDGAQARRYWRMVSEVGENYIELSKDVCESGSAIPQAGDKILQLGHRVEADSNVNAEMNSRRNAIFISSRHADGPRITFYADIDDFTLENKDRTTIGKNSKFVGTIMQTTDTGDIIRVPVYRGVWNAGSIYYYYEYVTYNGSLWIAMMDGVTSIPSEDNDEWQLYVAKGDSGTAGDDVAKWVEITGQRLYLYDTPDYTGTPNPGSVVLTCNTYGITSPTYQWKIIDGEQETVIGNTALISIPHDLFTNRTANVRCTVTNEDGNTYYDETQIAKLANGAEGLDAYYVDLSNSTVNIPYDSDGNSPLTPLTDMFTKVAAYHGINQVSVLNITWEVIQGNASVTILNDTVRLATLNTTTATIRLFISVADNVVLTKDWYVNKTHDGADGFDGVDASYALMSGEQVFKYDKTGAVSPVSITLTASIYSINNAQYQWYYSVAGANTWNVLADANYSTYEVFPNGSYFNHGDEITFKCEVVSANGGASYSDMMTINKLYDGVDGESVYRGVLSNEAHTVAATSNGAVTSSELSKASSTIRLWYGTTELSTSEFTVSESTTGGTVSISNSSPRRVTVSSMNADTLVSSISFKVDNKVVDVCDFTVTKAKAGAEGSPGEQGPEGPEGPQQLSIYRASVSQPSTPSFNYRGSVTNPWYLDIPSKTDTQRIWESKAMIDSTGEVVSTNPKWTTPAAITALDGADGNDGEAGPSLCYRGEWSIQDANQSSRIFGWTGNVRDVVKYNGVYYLWNSYYKGQSYTASNSNRPDMYSTATDGKAESDYNSSYKAYWTTFGSSFESIATGLLFAEEADIASWVFNDGYIRSKSGSICLYGGFDSAGSASWTPAIAIGSNLNGTGGYKDGAINNGAEMRIYRGGIIVVGGTPGNLRSGISGNGTQTNSIRFWAGNNNTNNAISAEESPFVVTDDGHLKASNATITGDIVCKTLRADNLEGLKLPGVTSIFHAGVFWKNLYSTGNGTITGMSNYNESSGTITITHDLNHTDYSILVIGSIRTNISISGTQTDSDAFRGFVTYTPGINTCTLKPYDTEGHLHIMGTSTTAVDIMLINHRL